jgi:hypothetical protein
MLAGLISRKSVTKRSMSVMIAFESGSVDDGLLSSSFILMQKGG